MGQTGLLEIFQETQTCRELVHGDGVGVSGGGGIHQELPGAPKWGSIHSGYRPQLPYLPFQDEGGNRASG